jgi:beta-glucosidase
MKKKEWLLGSLLLLVVARISGQDNYMAQPQLGKNKIADVIRVTTPEEKVYLLMGLGYPPPANPSIVARGFAGRTYDIPRLGITTTILSDGLAGLRIDVHPKDSDKAFYCTAFPAATGLSSTWNTELVETVGKAMGNEVLEYGCDVLLAPALNIQRNPLYGLSYTWFQYSDIEISNNAIFNDSIKVSLTIRNTGKISAKKWYSYT